MAQKIEAIIVNYRQGPQTQNSKECLLRFLNVPAESEVGRLVGRRVAWRSGRREIIGKIVALHGGRGLLRARFRRGLPGQALGTVVELVG